MANGVFLSAEWSANIHQCSRVSAPPLLVILGDNPLALPIECSYTTHDSVLAAPLRVHLRPEHEHGFGPAAQHLVGDAGDDES